MIIQLRSYAKRSHSRFWAVVLISLFAFVWRSFVTQTHLHFAPGTFAVAPRAGAYDGPQFTRQTPAPDLPIDCPICHDTALAGHYLSPAPIVLTALFVMLVWSLPIARLNGTRARPSHAWQSRAPPRAYSF